MWRDRARREELYSTAGYWDSKARRYDGSKVSMWPNEDLNVLYHREQVALLRDLLPDVRGLDVLDVGCGTGRLSRHFAEAGARVRGFDFSEESVRIARALSPGASPAYEVRSLFGLDAVAEVDVAVSWGVLTVACRDENQLLDALRRVRRALRPGGRAVLLEPIHRGPLHRVLDLSLSRFLVLMGEAGFSVEAVRQLHFWPMRLVLAQFSPGRCLTRAAYAAGQVAMRAPGLRGLGDYKAVLARS